MGFFKDLIGIAAPIIGAVVGGPAGAAIGGAIGGGIKGGAKGAILGAIGSYAGASLPGLFSSAGAAAGGAGGAFTMPTAPGFGAPALGGGFSANYDLFSSGGAQGVGGLGLSSGAEGLTGLTPTASTFGTNLVPEFSSGLGLQSGGAGFSPFLGNLSMGSGSMLSPQMLESMQFGPGGMQGGGSRELLKSLFPSGGLPPSLGNFASGALRYGTPVMQMLAGMQARSDSERLRKQIEASVIGMPNPAEVTALPGYQAGLEAVQRSMAAQGYQGSGNMMAALAQYGQNAYDKHVQQSQNQSQLRLASAVAGSGPAFANQTGLALLSSGMRGLGGMQ